jgi:hypothetical protein
MNPHEKLELAARRFVSLLDSPQPGLITWNEAVEAAYQEMRAAIVAEETKRKYRL